MFRTKDPKVTLGSVNSKLDSVNSKLDSVVERVLDRIELTESVLRKEMDDKIEGVMEKMDERFDEVSTRIDGVEQSLGKKIDGVEQSLGKRIDGAIARIDETLQMHERDINQLKDVVHH